MSAFKPIGFKRYECWADALLLPKDSAAWGAAEHMYVNCFDGVRIMSKFEEWEKHPDLYQRNTVEKARRARELGLEVMLCLDWHNTAGNSAGYHKYRYIPDNLSTQVKAIIQDIKPDIVQVANEPYHIQTGKSLTTKQYAYYVYEYIKGMKRAGFKGLMVAEQSRKEQGDLRDSWEWHVYPHPDDPDALIERWDFCAEGKHRLPRVLHDNTYPLDVLAELESNAWASRSRPKGWNFAIFQDEFSSVGRGIHINSVSGADSMRLSMQFFKRKKAPVGWLTMGGSSETFGGEGGWGMHTQLVNSLGEVSKGGQALLTFLGKPQYDGGSEPPPPDKIDMLELMAPSSVDFAKTSPKGGRMSTIRDDASRTFVLSKYDGKTWDWFYWDDTYIYHFLTEDGAIGDTTTFKTHVAPGVKWCKRFAKLGESHVSSPKLHRWANCQQGPVISMDSARTTLHSKSYTAGELGMASDDLPSSTVCYRIDWQWGPSIEHLETFTYAAGWGWLGWDHIGYDSNPFNRRSSKPIVQPDFPCFNVPDWVDENMRPVDPPPPPPPGEVPPGGWNTIQTPHAAHMKMNNAEVKQSYDKIKAGGHGSNHMITRQCAVLPEDVPTVERQLKAIIDSWK